MEAESRNESGIVVPNMDPTTGQVDDRASSYRRMVDEIVDNGHLYNFFELVHLLRRISKTQTTAVGAHPKREVIRFRPSSSVVFPATDVKRVEWSGKDTDPITIVASFMGLYGFDSPLPVYFSRDIELHAQATNPLKSFLDIFNNRLYLFYYRAWEKYRPARMIRDDGSDESTRRFLAVAGLATKTQTSSSPGEDLRLAAFAGQLGSTVRSADGLRNLLRGVFPGMQIQIEENIPRWVWLSERRRLGQTATNTGAVLGETATIGEKIQDLSGKFRIVLGPLGLDQFESFLPGGESTIRIQSVVDHFVTDLLDYDVKLRLISQEVPMMVLGDPERKLGLNTWLRQPTSEFSSRLVAYNHDQATA
ncbi:MAG: type VI secretion system baseplate subunit TssG [Rhodothermia bacterium]|nr:MAG: type VI secretion system baseplate subunit TssG [Rhodothermia bacterium]